ncbi:Single-stranded DNA-binding protein [Romboutsia ilealis]|uniref:Single-stranded DNA-binding protein n=1 Tax=Romboutsia ilealis TaxID=1115758 RepID=A0A1V1HYM2_9FIRM|nr:single-stranded DNA-binding protein [Romboutsia ilealis]CED93056.1 Single-stranded DNA-binding protein [Romboutsia ilealis]
MNNVVLVGRLTKDPELRYVGEKNNALTNFSLAVDRGYKNLQGESKVDFINIEIWGKQAEIFCTYMEKGKMVGIEGKIIADKYKNENGENRYITRVRANSFRFLDSKNKNIATVGETEANYYNSNTLFNQVDKERGLSIEELPF